ncbi:MAG TPA: YchJ family protein [Deltaproteobacteria bacterium]|nr:YchJ family protein [Deltaproteobacteria bacterium]HQB38852.1 YchJ family protein [Deltaproteobacteria bacterium]
MNKCYCGSDKTFPYCCKPIITGKKPAPTAEKLIRARYSAYVTADMAFILNTTHPDHRDDFDEAGSREWAESSQWEGLEIVATKQGGENDTTGQVEFIARFSQNGKQYEHHELSTFDKVDGVWYFTDGQHITPQPITVQKIGRNAPCPCGSGLKYKKCCGK